MTITKADCDAVRDIVNRFLDLRDQAALAASAIRDDAAFRSMLADILIEADAELTRWHATWTADVREHFELTAPVLKSGDYPTACETTASQCFVHLRSIIMATIEDGVSRDSRRALAKAYNLTRGEIAAEWRAAVKAITAPNDSADNAKKPENNLPENPDVRDLCLFLKAKRSDFATEIMCARGFCERHGIETEKASSLMRQARRYPHLWRR